MTTESCDYYLVASTFHSIGDYNKSIEFFEIASEGNYSVPVTVDILLVLNNCKKDEAKRREVRDKCIPR